MRWGVLLLLGLAACIEPNLVECPGGYACAAGAMCDDIHRQCVTQDQLDACELKPDLSPCLDGYCDQGVCLAIRCGNGRLDPGEVCDDGNDQDHDGCNLTCTSTQACGNGLLDPGEACEDANLVDGDGCSSGCEAEHEEFRLEGISVGYSTLPSMIHDAARHQLVQIAEPLMWRWDGARWTIIPTTNAPGGYWNWKTYTYDPDRQKIVQIGIPQFHPGVDTIVEWDGATWTQRTATGSALPNYGSALTTYDPVRKALLLLSYKGATMEMWSLDLSSATWTKLVGPSGIGSITGAAFGFDIARGTAVFVQPQYPTPKTFEWNGAAWTTVTTPIHATSAWALVYDPTQSALLAVGGVASAGVSKWTGTAWTPIPAMTLPQERELPDIAFDGDRGRLVSFGGRRGFQLFHEIYEWTGSAWSDVSPALPIFTDSFGNLHYAYDSLREEIVQVGVPSGPGLGTWVHDRNGWRRLPSLPGPTSRSAIAYDPIRDACVANLEDQSTWLLTDELWLPLELPGTSPAFGMRALVYDPTRAAVIGIDPDRTWALPSGATTWTLLGPAPVGSAGSISLAFDARRSRVMLAINTETYDLIGNDWVQTLGPSAYSTNASDNRRGSVIFNSATYGRAERLDGVWRDLPPPPLYVNGGTIYIDATGELVDIGTVGKSRVLQYRRYVASTERETCDDLDRDADQRFGCDDPDCYWMCGGCPPFASCP